MSKSNTGNNSERSAEYFERCFSRLYKKNIDQVISEILVPPEDNLIVPNDDVISISSDEGDNPTSNHKNDEAIESSLKDNENNGLCNNEDRLIIDSNLSGCDSTSTSKVTSIKKSDTLENKTQISPMSSDDASAVPVYEAIVSRNFPCIICDGILSSRSNLIIHLRSHSQEAEPFTCQFCQIRLRRSYLYRHSKCHFNHSIHECHLCDKKFCFKYQLKTHMQRHDSERTYLCTICEGAYRKEKDLKSHLLTHNKIFQCENCSKQFEKKGKLLQHLKVCLKIRKPQNLQIHLLTEQLFYKIFEDKSCIENSTTTVNRQLKRKQFHTNSQHLKSILDKHRKLYQNKFKISKGILKLFKLICPICGRSFTTKNAFRSHKAIHFASRYHACNLCGHAYIKQSSLNCHKIVHQLSRCYDLGW